VSGSPAELQAGRVGRAHGLDGSFYVTGPVPRLLALGSSVTVGERTAAIVRRAGTDARPILRLDGVEDRAGAEALRGQELTVAATVAPQLGEGEWWAHELQECEVFADELLLGTVRRLIELPSCEAIEVDDRSGGDPLLVPMVKDAIRNVDVAARRIEVDGDFLDLSARRPAARKAQTRGRAPGKDAGASSGAGTGGSDRRGD
jgi:16S rRNA processing protein RimM